MTKDSNILPLKLNKQPLISKLHFFQRKQLKAREGKRERTASTVQDICILSGLFK